MVSATDTAMGTTIMVSSSPSSPLAHYAFPRTGKRGVPQQFPRRLYEMLDCETKCMSVDADHPKIIAWSDSGKAFRIYDVTDFAAIVLPKYFRTKKFSSFQRNLNLYGFTKVRRGVDTDMYAHPSFMKDHPEGLMQLHKITTKTSRITTTTTTTVRRRDDDDNGMDTPPRSVSPSHSPRSQNLKSKAMTPKVPTVRKLLLHGFNEWTQQQQHTPVSPPSSSGEEEDEEEQGFQPCSSHTTHSVLQESHNNDCDTHSTESDNSGAYCPRSDRGKLHLLALALECEFASRPC